MKFAEMWMDLGTVIQSEANQKEKNKYHILTHICGNQKKDIDQSICKAEIETQTQRINIWTPRKGRRGGMNQEIGINIYPMYKTDN